MHSAKVAVSLARTTIFRLPVKPVRFVVIIFGDHFKIKAAPFGLPFFHDGRQTERVARIASHHNGQGNISSS
jgi:hypothetical protein